MPVPSQKVTFIAPNSLHVTLTANRNACLPVGRGFATLTLTHLPIFIVDGRPTAHDNLNGCFYPPKG
jgi:hypothetical protein